MKNYISRPLYIKRIEPFIDKSIIKVITGQRRIGKSYILLQISDIIKKNIPEANIIFGEFYQFNLSSCIRQQNSLTAQFVSFSLSNLANIFYPSQFLQ